MDGTNRWTGWTGDLLNFQEDVYRMLWNHSDDYDNILTKKEKKNQTNQDEPIRQ